MRSIFIVGSISVAMTFATSTYADNSTKISTDLLEVCGDLFTQKQVSSPGFRTAELNDSDRATADHVDEYQKWAGEIAGSPTQAVLSEQWGLASCSVTYESSTQETNKAIIATMINTFGNATEETQRFGHTLRWLDTSMRGGTIENMRFAGKHAADASLLLDSDGVFLEIKVRY